MSNVVIVGGGYVGLPLAIVVAEAGHSVVVLESNPTKVVSISCGNSYVGDVSSDTLKNLVNSKRIHATSDPQKACQDANVVLICVPTPLKMGHEPDPSFVITAVDEIAPHIKPKTLVALESTVYPGFTRDVVAKRLQGFTPGVDIFISFSPERVDPMNANWTTKNTPKVVGGLTPACCEVANAFYASIVDSIVPVKSADVAELTKLLENTYRSVNIALVNEFAIAAHRLGIDIWDVVNAAKTKPFGFQSFVPGPGTGGECLPCDPEYLNWKMQTLRYDTQLLQTAQRINRLMPNYVIERLTTALSDIGLPVRGANIIIVGVAYKPDVPDTRESPAIAVIEELQHRGANVEYIDKHVNTICGLNSLFSPDYTAFDAAVIITHHSDFDYAMLVKTSKLVLDTRGVTRGIVAKNIVLL